MARLKAFTLLELSIALILSGIAMALAFAVISNVSTSAVRWFGMDASSERIRAFHLVFLHDVDRGATVELDQGSIVITMANGMTIQYARHGEVLLREGAGMPDTVLLDVQTITGSWLGGAVRETKAHVDVVEIRIGTADASVDLFFNKYYDAMTLRALSRADADPSAER